MRSFLFRVLAVGWAGFLGFLILTVGAGIWSALVAVNLSVSPGIPWAVPVMTVVLVLLWAWLAGKGWPQSTAEARRRSLRPNLVSKQVLGWSVLAGTLSVVGLAGLWIVLVQLVRMPGNALPDLSRYPPWTVAALILMGSAAAPLTEEPAFRGYSQVILERNFSAPVAVCISSMLFALAHGPTQGFLWPKLLFYFLVGLVFGSTAWLTDSILPAIPSHFLGLVIFFSFIWPQDASRTTIWKTGAHPWFWIHAVQAIVFATLAIWSFRRLALVCGPRKSRRDRI